MTEQRDLAPLARIVHGVAVFGGSVEDVMRASAYTPGVVRLAISFIEPDEVGTDTTVVSWQQALEVLISALGRLQS